jgi:hypothetical protein
MYFNIYKQKGVKPNCNRMNQVDFLPGREGLEVVSTMLVTLGWGLRAMNIFTVKGFRKTIILRTKYRILIPAFFGAFLS